MVRRRRKSGTPWLAVLAALAAGALGYDLLRKRHHPPAAVPLPQCPIDEPTPGIDVSYYQGDISWSRVHRAGIRFAFIRVADGTDVLDTKFEQNWKAAHEAAIPRGVYQYFRANESPIDQADLVIAALRRNGSGELPPVIDVESTEGLPLSDVAAAARQWIDHIRTELHVEPIVYTNPGMWGLRGAPELATQPLWLAHYTSTCPMIPPPWRRWSAWQYSEGGRVDGIDGFVDLDVWNGPVPAR